MKKQKLKDYIRTQLNPLAKEVGADGYTKWLAENTPDLTRLSAEESSNIDTAYKKSLSVYGVEAENLREEGLSRSGYSDYLDTRAKFLRDEALSDVKGKYTVEEAKGVSGYAEYLDNARQERDKLIVSASKRIKELDIMDLNDATVVAMEFGLKKDLAQNIARRATERVRTEFRRKIIEDILDKNLSREQAEEYARSYGLIESDVKRIGDTAFMLNQLPHLDSSTMDTYLNYLKDMEQTKRK